MNLFYTRLLVNAQFASRLPAKMFNRVGDVNLPAINLYFFKAFTQELACRPDERPALFIHLVAWQLSDHHDSDFRLGALVAALQFPKDGPGCISVEVAF